MSAPLDLDAVEALANAATPGPWNVWKGPYYTGGAADLCIGAGKEWLANMDHRHCEKIREATFEPWKCDGRDPDNMTCDICSIDSGAITEEQAANAAFIAAARTLVPQLVARVRVLEAGLTQVTEAMVERAARAEAFALVPDKSWRLFRSDTRRAYMDRARMILTAALKEAA